MNILHDYVQKATKTIDDNKDTFIAQYILQNPDVNMKDVILVYKPSLSDVDYVEFSIERKKST